MVSVCIRSESVSYTHLGFIVVLFSTFGAGVILDISVFFTGSSFCLGLYHCMGVVKLGNHCAFFNHLIAVQAPFVAGIAPVSYTHLVCIIENAQELGPGGQNALLKILEEPPAGVRFVLTVPGRSALLPTIVSRTLVARVQPLSVQECFSLVRPRIPADGFPDGELWRLCLVFGGCAGQVLAAAGDPQTSESYRRAVQLCTAVASGDEWSLATGLAELEDKSKDLSGCLQLMIHLFHLSLLSKSGSLPDWQQDTDPCGRMSTAALARCIQCCETQARYIQGNMARPLAVTALAAGLSAH